MRGFVFLFFSVFSLTAFAQTVGTIQYDAGTFEGYNLVHPLNFDTTYLIDNCGHVVQKWTAPHVNGPYAEITPDGHLIRSLVDPNATDFIAGGATGLIYEYDWDGNFVWQYTLSDANYRMHHDMERLPNGNMLVVAWEKKDSFECIDAGRIPGTMQDNELWPTVIFELEPTYPSGANIVWEWHAWDHLVQDYDAQSNNYGDVQANYRKIDINKGNANNVADWAHVNAIHYNADLDHILISSPTFNEIWMIDHSTTTAEAATSSGGDRGHGGDLLWRWGNPESYNSGTSADQQLFFQHDCQWVEVGARFPEHISVYDNRDTINGQLGSKAKIMHVVFDTLNNEYPMSNGTFLPIAPDYTYDLADSLFSPRVSGVQVLPNDNILIASGSNGHVIEIDSDDNVLWQYKLPISTGGVIQTQGVTPGLTKDIFKMENYAPDFAGFTGRDMTPGPQIELNPISCTASVGLSELTSGDLLIYPNPSQGTVTIEGCNAAEPLLILDMSGRTVKAIEFPSGSLQINTSDWKQGIYVVCHGAAHDALVVQ